MSETNVPGEVDADLEKARDYPADVEYRPAEEPDAEEYEPASGFGSSYDDEEIVEGDDELEHEEAAEDLAAAPALEEE